MTWKTAFGIVLLYVLVCVLLSSMRIFLYRFFDIEWSISTKPRWWIFLNRKVFFNEFEPGVLRSITSYGWCGLVPFVVAAVVGGFARGDVSPLPWVAFAQGNQIAGVLRGAIFALLVVIGDIWLFFGASQWALWCEKDRPDQNAEIMAMKKSII